MPLNVIAFGSILTNKNKRMSHLELKEIDFRELFGTW